MQLKETIGSISHQMNKEEENQGITTINDLSALECKTILLLPREFMALQAEKPIQVDDQGASLVLPMV